MEIQMKLLNFTPPNDNEDGCQTEPLLFELINTISSPIFISTSKNKSHGIRHCNFTHNSFVLYSMLPSVFILLLLSSIEHRKKVFSFEKLFPCLSSRFGVVVPLDFTSSLENRWSYAFAFGAVNPLIFRLFFGIINPFPFTPPFYLKVFVFLVAAFEVGIACKPFFICLSTPNQLLGGFLGMLYTLAWLIVQLWDSIWCKGSHEFDSDSFESFSIYYEWLFEIPHLLSLVFLFFRFCIIIVKELLICLKKQSKEKEIKKHQYKHVQRLLKRPDEASVQKCWLRRHVYDWDPYFKFPNRIITTVMLSFHGIYMIVLCEQIVSSWCIVYILEQLIILDLNIDYSIVIRHWDYITYSWYISTALAVFLSTIHIIHVLVYYRKHVKSLWTGDHKYLPETYKLKPAVNVTGLLKYPGYQLAFSMWGYVITHVAMFTATLGFVYLVILPIRQHGVLPWLLNFISLLTNFLIMFCLMRLQRIVVRTFFLQDKISSQDKEKPLALNNRKVFHNFNYYLYFFNLMLGMGSCVLRLIRSASVALMLLSRIERTIMPQGFKKLDTSHSTWLGMIITDHHHNNPVLVCFCHLLLKHTLCVVKVDETRVKSDRPVMKRALLRWLLVYTLLRNPTLILLRKSHWHVNREALEQAFIWSMTNQSNRRAPESGKYAFMLISALHSFSSEFCREGSERNISS